MNKKDMYVLIDACNGIHYGFTFDETKARDRARKIEEDTGYQIDTYEFRSYEEF